MGDRLETKDRFEIILIVGGSITLILIFITALYTYNTGPSKMKNVEVETGVVEVAIAERGELTLHTTDGTTVSFRTYTDGSRFKQSEPYVAPAPAKGSTVKFKRHPDGLIQHNELLSVVAP